MNSPKKKNTKILFMLAAVFLIPVIAAKLVLNMNWYQGAATNKGELLPENLSYQNLLMENPNPEKWQLVYLLPTQCEQNCKQQLYLLHQTYLALGREQDRVIPLIATQPNSDLTALADYQFETAKASKALQQELQQQQIIIVDPIGKLVTRYPMQSDQQQLLLQGKAMMNDLRKMLKLSRVG
ncbi:hypothetical protein D5R81_07900 [Parashewanella spongiae]|uniref:Cytochrome oxidase assembly protein n=1 Tax=Parashewanella spongiae TaxID=342950 RepID=A0A3A6TX22_9GAMM|nr:hypothetical protein [Parashewanella spongiae]MCL1077866.1 hypothetical protein [Parashewanella spongiae]RJY17615.1 hypothetical protein D5R81_07900 [Parashewanella spongiae]